METLSPEKLAELESEYQIIHDAHKLRLNDVKVASAGAHTLYILPSAENNLNLELAKLKSTPTDNEVTVQLNEIAESVGTLTPSHNASLFACFPSMTLLSCRLKKQTFA